MHRLSEFFEYVIRDGTFNQTQFTNSDQQQSICFVAAEKYLHQVNKNPAITCVVTTEGFGDGINETKGLVISPTPEKAFYRLHNRLVSEFQMQPMLEPAVNSSALIHPTAHVDEYVSIGEDVEIGPGAVVLGGSILKQGVLVGPNAVIGAEGHFYKRYDGCIFRVLHAGGVLLEQGAQVLAGAVVSKALHTDFTIIGVESVISIKAHVGHGCKIGERCIIGGNAQISGYTELKNDVWIAPSVTIGSLISVGNNAAVETGSVVVESVKDGDRVSGNFAIDHRANMMNYVKAKRKIDRK